MEEAPEGELHQGPQDGNIVLTRRHHHHHLLGVTQGTVGLRMIIARQCNLDQFHDLPHHGMEETTGGPQVLERMVEVLVMVETTGGPQVPGRMVGVFVM